MILFVPVLFYASATQAALLWEARGIDSLKAAHLSGTTEEWQIPEIPGTGMGPLDNLARPLRQEMAEQLIGLRFAVHREFAKGQLELWGPYEGIAGQLIPRDAVAAEGAAGVIPYYLSGLTFIDLNGLNDKTVARNPVTVPNSQRLMAHDRCPPTGYLERRGVNFMPRPAAASADEAHRFTPYAVHLSPELWLPFDTNEPPEWVAERFAEFSSVQPSQVNTVPAVIVSEGAPVVGELFTVRLSDATRSAGFTNRSLWAWERGSGAGGWTWAWAYGACGHSFPTYHYIPSEADVGLHLRAYVYYIDHNGNWVKAVTPASAPVQAK